ALLEAMQERQVTTEGRTRRLGPPFLGLATQNPIGYEGPPPLPGAQLRRFLLRAGIGYPSRDDEWGMLARRLERRADELLLDPVAGRAERLPPQGGVEEVYVHESVGHYVVDLVAATRANPRVRVGASPRGTIAVAKLARVGAWV